MFGFGLIAGWVCAAAWGYLLLAHGRFWRTPLTAGDLSHSQRRGINEAIEPTIAVVIPARNEADVIARAIASLVAVDASALSLRLGDTVGRYRLHIFVVDDNSTDGTAEAARAAGSGATSRVTVISGRPLPPGWSGKLWAVQQGVEQALRLNPDFLLLTDADIEHAPGSIAMLVSIAEAGAYDLASFMVKLHCRSVAEKLLIPAFAFFFFMLYPPEWVRDARRHTAGAAGGCMLLRPAALERIGGIAAIRHEIIDDCALARAVKRSGGKVWLGAAPATQSLRPYKSFGKIERMVARTAFSQLNHSFWLLVGTVLGMLLLFALPIALMLSRSAILAFAGAFAYGLMTFLYLPMVRYYRLNPLWALTLPVAAMFYIAATIHSALKFWSGHGGKWKDRAQDVG